MRKISAPYETYNGGKSGQGNYQTIINRIPPCELYIEPFLGNGGIFRNLMLPSRVIINDIDPVVYINWSAMQLPAGTHLYNQDAIDIIKNHSQDDRTTMIYLDPPYSFTTRKGDKALYRYSWAEEQHFDFLTAVLTCKCNVMISHPRNEMYENALQGWFVHDYQYTSRQGLMWDRLWMNYPPPVIRQDYRYIGNDYRDRENIKRKATRWVNKLKVLPSDQQVAILSALFHNLKKSEASTIITEALDLPGIATVEGHGTLKQTA